MYIQQSYMDELPTRFKDVKFMSGEEKAKVLQDWERFLKSGCEKGRFTKVLYHHLINHCSFMAHYDLKGFYHEYFTVPQDTIRFLSQFDTRFGGPRSIEIGGIGWVNQPEYQDINIAMCDVAAKYIPVLTANLKQRQREDDINHARALLNKHGIDLKGVTK